MVPPNPTQTSKIRPLSNCDCSCSSIDSICRSSFIVLPRTWLPLLVFSSGRMPPPLRSSERSSCVGRDLAGDAAAPSARADEFSTSKPGRLPERTFKSVMDAIGRSGDAWRLFRLLRRFRCEPPPPLLRFGRRSVWESRSAAAAVLRNGLAGR